ncbi:MAG: hypothetical protein VB082_07680 [Christensenella sp.]|nr:hypothetical protein [Christensenella sp.]
MKKALLLLLVICVTFAMFTGCAASDKNAIYQSATAYTEKFISALEELDISENSMENITITQNADEPNRVAVEFADGMMVLLADSKNNIMASAMIVLGEPDVSARYFAAAYSTFSELVVDQSLEEIQACLEASEDGSFFDVELDAMISGEITENGASALIGNAASIGQGGDKKLRSLIEAGFPEIEAYGSMAG